jgi:hypothetical protein
MAGGRVHALRAENRALRGGACASRRRDAELSACCSAGTSRCVWGADRASFLPWSLAQGRPGGAQPSR